MVLVGFIVLSVLITWPMVVHLGDRVRDVGDPIFTGWVLPWDVNALIHHPFSIFQANVFYPEPNTLAYADHMIGLAPIAAPFWLITHDPIVTNNGTVVVLIALAGFSAYLLSKEVCGRHWPAVVSGVIFAMAPYHFAHIAHTNLLSSYPMPLTILFAIRLVRRQRALDALGLFAFFVLTMGSSWYYFVFVSLALLPIVAVEVFVRRDRLPWKRLIALFSAAATGVGIVAAVWAMPYLAVQKAHPEAKRPLTEAETYTPGPSDFLLTSADNRIYGEATAPLRAEGGESEKVLFSGWIPVVLAAMGISVAVRKKKLHLYLPYIAVAVGMLAIAFGPYQTFLGGKHRMPFFYFYTYVPGMQFMRSMGRAQVLVTLSISVLASVGLSGIRRRPDRSMVCLAVGVLVAAELLSAPVRMEWAPKADPIYKWLSDAPAPGAVLVLPTAHVEDDRIVDSSKIREARYMSFSTQNWRPLLNGYSGFSPPSYRVMVDSVADFPDEKSVRFLRQLDVAYVVVDLDLVKDSRWSKLASAPEIPGFKIAYRTDHNVAYAVPRR